MHSMWRLVAAVGLLNGITSVGLAQSTTPVTDGADPIRSSAPSTFSMAAADSESILFKEYMSLDELLGQRMGVSTIKELTPREAPNVLTIITADEIADTGARDLLDVLRLVPAFEFGADVSGVVSIGVRGLWGHEGKVLLLWDGLPINELLYGTLMVGNHFPVEQIQQIEIIRGPGSAIYGGYAEMAVINVKTKTGKDLNGLSSSVLYSQMEKTYSHRNLSFSFGKSIGELDVSGHVLWGQGNRSDQLFESFYTGYAYDMSTGSQLNPYMLNFSLRYQGLEMRVLQDYYRTTQRDWWGATLYQAVRADFDTTIFDIKYAWNIFPELTITPRITLKEQAPYKRNGIGTQGITYEGESMPDDIPFEIWAKRQTESVTASYDIDDNNNVIAGVEAYQEQADYISDPKRVKYNNVAVFSQALVDLLYVNLTAGGRWEKHNQYGESFVPRIGLTRVMDDLHVKLLYSQAFRAPQFESINLNPDIRPERSIEWDFEVGYKITDQMFVTANLFDTRIEDTIIYYADSEGEHQENGGQMNTRGVEVEVKYREKWGFVNLGYSFNHGVSNDVFIYQVPGHDDRLIALPAHKLVLNSKIQLLGDLTLNPSVIYFSSRFGWWRSGEPVKEFAPVVVANIFLTYALPIKGLKLGLGVNDIADAKPVFIQAYYGEHAPIPGPSRSYIGKITYDYHF